MRKGLFASTIIFILAGIVFTVLSKGILAVLFAGIAAIIGFLSVLKSEKGKTRIPKWLFFIAILTMGFAAGKEVFVKKRMIDIQQDGQQKFNPIQDKIKPEMEMKKAED